MQITIDKFFPTPKPGKKTGAIKDTNGNWYDIWPDKTAGVQQGGTYDITTSQRDYNGRTYYTVQTITPVQQNHSEPPPAGHNGAPDGFDSRGKAIFVTGVVQQAMNSGKFVAADIPTLVEFALDGWNRLVNGPQRQQPPYQPPVGGREPPPPASEDDYGGGYPQ